jgi:hypothetical protein
MPFGALQFVIILLASYLAQSARVKGIGHAGTNVEEHCHSDPEIRFGL